MVSIADINRWLIEQARRTSENPFRPPAVPPPALPMDPLKPAGLESKEIIPGGDFVERTTPGPSMPGTPPIVPPNVATPPGGGGPHGMAPFGTGVGTPAGGGGPHGMTPLTATTVGGGAVPVGETIEPGGFQMDPMKRMMLSQALMAMGGQMLSGGYTRAPQGALGNIGAGIQAGAQVYQAAPTQYLQRQLMQEKLETSKEARKRRGDLAKALAGRGGAIDPQLRQRMAEAARLFGPKAAQAIYQQAMKTKMAEEARTRLASRGAGKVGATGGAAASVTPAFGKGATQAGKLMQDIEKFRAALQANPNDPALKAGLQASITKLRNLGITEGMRKAAGFAQRGEKAEQSIRGLGGYTPDFWDQMTAGGWASFLASGKGQQYTQAARQWISAILRYDSGAAVPEVEFQRYFRTYFPQAGDSEATIAQKRASRDAEIQKLRQSSGGAYGTMFGGAQAGGRRPTHRYNPSTGKIGVR